MQKIFILVNEFSSFMFRKIANLFNILIKHYEPQNNFPFKIYFLFFLHIRVHFIINQFFFEKDLFIYSY